MLAIAFGFSFAFLSTSAPAAAQSECSSSAGTQFSEALDGGLYTFDINEWNSTLNECVSIGSLGFTITTADFSNSTSGAPATYTSIYRGCHWGACTTSNPFPIEESNIGSASTSVSITQPSGSQNDSAYDIWFNQTSTTTGQPNGTEVMIWINHQGAPQPFGSQVATATIDGASYAVWTGNQTSWKIISYVATSPVTSASLNLLPFFADAVSRGSLESTWWLIDVEYGFEVWTGGQGLAVNSYSVSAAAGSGGGGSCTTAPSAPSGLAATTSSSSVINLAWTADTAPANCTISGYNVYRSASNGFTPSSSNQIASGVTATSYSSSGLTASTTYFYKIEAVDAAGTSGASAQASATTSASSGGGGGGSSSCTVDYMISPQNSSAFGAAISITNGSTAITSWTLTWTFANGQTISSLWNGVETQSGSNVMVKNESYNGSIAANGTLTGIGFNGIWNGSANAVPTAISLNGTACTVN